MSRKTHTSSAAELPLVAIVGRPNAGKSTLFNRLIGERRSIVHDTPGVTRDRLEAEAEIQGVRIRVADTGGIVWGRPSAIEKAATEQARAAVGEATAVIFLVDGREPMPALDEKVADILRKSGKPAILAVNKIDTPTADNLVFEYYQIGFDPVFAISAEHGRGVDSLMTGVLALMGCKPDIAGVTMSEDVLIAVVGKPNAGKSTFVNALLGSTRQIVSELPGTTRDSVDLRLTFQDRNIVLIDTAGIRRKRNVREDIEYYAVRRALASIERCDTVILVLDATQPVSDQDKKIASYTHDLGRGIVIAANKWDLASPGTSVREFSERCRHDMKFLSYAPIVAVSALTGQRVHGALQLALQVFDESSKRIPTHVFNNFLEKLQARHQAPSSKGRAIKFYFGAQVAVHPPAFVIQANYPDQVHGSYQRFVINAIREQFGFAGVPIRVHYRTKSGRAEGSRQRSTRLASPAGARRGAK